MSLVLKTWEKPDRGALFVVSGASGSGKTTLVKEALRVVPGLGFSVSATTRAIRAGEKDGVDYHFVDDARFDRLLEENSLLEWARVYDRRYGTPRAPVEEALARGESILLDIDVQGARQVRRSFPEAVTLFVLPKDPSDLEKRLRARGTDSEEVILRRMGQLREQMDACGEFDFLVTNDDLSTAHACFQAVLVAELQRRTRRSSVVKRFVQG